MSLFNLSSDNQYVVSLDSFELSLLHQYVDKPPDGERRVLYRSTAFMDGESTYCQVNIEPNQVHDGNCYYEPANTYICHICDIDVPINFYKQHVGSKMHQIHRKLTLKVLRNVAKHISADEDHTGCNELSNLFYCDTCSKVVLVENKQEHNKSMHHLKSIENLKMSENFVEFFIDKTGDDNATDDEIESVNDFTDASNIARQLECQSDSYSDSDTDQSNNSNTDFERTHNCDLVLPEIVRIDSSELLNIHEPSSSKGESSKTADQVSRRLRNFNQHIDNFQMYLKEMIVEHKLQFKMPAIDGNFIVIVTPKGLMEKVTTNTFHGFTTINNLLGCLLCRTYVETYSVHIRTEMHVMNIIHPVDDDFARDVIFNKGFSHCLVCNILVAKGSNHAAQTHKMYNEPMPLSPTIVTTNSLPHAESEEHKDNVKNQNDESLQPTSSNEERNFSTHSYSNEHEENGVQPPIDSNSVAGARAKLYCQICNVMIPQGQMAIHEGGKKHQKKCSTNKTPNQHVLNVTAAGTYLPNMSQAVPVNLSAQRDTNEFAIQENLPECNTQITCLSAYELQNMMCNLMGSSSSDLEGSEHKNE